MSYDRIAARALVTGASSGIGRAFANALATRGSDLVLVARDAHRLEDLATRIRDEHGRRAEVVTADLTRPEALARIETLLREDPHIDLLVNNAGYGVTGNFGERDVSQAQGQVDLNVTALTRLAHAALSTMRPARRGGIINIASGAAFLPSPTLAVYAATKAYVTSFSQALHEEVAADGVTVTVVCPGFTRTEFQARAGYATAGVPDIAWQSAEDVVRESLAAFVRRRVVCIPGTPNRALASLVRLVPHSMLAGLVARLAPPQAKGGSAGGA